jgi:hypothetical protein
VRIACKTVLAKNGAIGVGDLCPFTAPEAVSTLRKKPTGRLFSRRGCVAYVWKVRAHLG